MSKNRGSNRDGIYMRGPAYCISYVDGQGIRRQEKTEAQTHTQAKAIRAQKLHEAEKQRVLGYVPPSKDTFADFIPQYLAHQKARLTPRAYERSRGIVEKHLKQKFGQCRLAEIRKGDVLAYITARSADVGPASVRKEFNVLKHMLSVAVDKELVPANHAMGVKAPKPPAGRLRYLQPTEVSAVMPECPKWLQPIALLLLATGMRRGEVLGLRWLDVDRRGERILLPQTKNGHGRTVHLNALALATIDSLTRGTARPTDRVFPKESYGTPENVSLAFMRACRRVEIEDFRLHDLRHTAASWMAMTGSDIHTTATQLGHDVKQSARYQHLSPKFLQTAVRGLDSVFGLELVGSERILAPAKAARPVTIA